MLRDHEDLTEAQTAAALGIKVGTVKSQARDALRRLREAVPGLSDAARFALIAPLRLATLPGCRPRPSNPLPPTPPRSGSSWRPPSCWCSSSPTSSTRCCRPKHPHGGDPSNNIPALKAVKTYDYAGNHHTTDPVTYTETPPAGGPHDPVWEDCGVYTQQIRNENACTPSSTAPCGSPTGPARRPPTSRPSQTALGSVKDKKTILSPYPGLPAPVVVTVWNAQLDLKGASDPRLAQFLELLRRRAHRPRGRDGVVRRRGQADLRLAHVTP